MALYDPTDCAYSPNTINGNNRQVLGDIIVQAPQAGAIGAVLTTARQYGVGASGIYRRYKNRMHTNVVTVDVVA